MGETPSVDILQTLSTSLHLPKTFLLDLLLEDTDWAFVVKAHALVETATTTLLIDEIGQPKLEKFISRLGAFQRLKMLTALDLCSPEQRKMMRNLGELRNERVHTAHGSLFSFAEYLKDESLRTQFWKAFGIDKGGDGGPDLSLISPRLAVWMQVVGVVVMSFPSPERAQLNALRARVKADVLLSLMGGSQTAEPE